MVVFSQLIRVCWQKMLSSSACLILISLPSFQCCCSPSLHPSFLSLILFKLLPVLVASHSFSSTVCSHSFSSPYLFIYLYFDTETLKSIPLLYFSHVFFSLTLIPFFPAHPSQLSVIIRYSSFVVVRSFSIPFHF